MLFNSSAFAIFLPVVFTIYWLLNKRDLRIQNILLLLSSYYFYACWDWRFLFLLIFSTLLDYITGIKMSSAPSASSKKYWFWLSVIVNIGFLGIFKYYNFFATSFAELVSSIGFHVNPWTLKVILPVGISFYTFHGLSYVIDIYKDRIKAEKNLTDYALFVSFFPLLVAGPIERATHLLPQLKKKRAFDYSMGVNGLRQILWGIFKKVVIADNCSEYSNQIFNNHTEYSGSTLLLGAFFFSLQIYGDFSGYSDIALGTARLFGIELLKNFSFPYFSRDIAEFWRRWHISLSTWFKDYLYIPLGGSKGGNWLKARNTFAIFLVSGFWHGANWTFIAWGFLNALFIMPSILFKTNRNNLDIVAQGRLIPNLTEIIQVGFTFTLTTFAWIFFRSETITQAISFIKKIFTYETLIPLHGLFSDLNGLNKSIPLTITFLFATEWIYREKAFALESIKLKYGLNWVLYMLILFIIIFFGEFNQTEFIYFQF